MGTSAQPDSQSAKKSVLGRLRSPNSFSRKELLVFAVIFGLVGGYVLWRSFAAAPTVATLEAEQMSLPAGAAALADTSASGGQAVKFTSVGAATGAVNLSAASTSLSVVAKAVKCGKTWPRLAVAVDGTSVISATVSDTAWHSYSVAKDLTSGNHSLSLSFTSNSKGKHACVPVLYLDVTSFYGTAPPPPAVPTVTLSASPSTLAAGSSSTLTWNSTSADSCTASGAWSGSQALSGSKSTGALNSTSIYNLNCTGAGGTASASATVTVSAPPPTQPPPPTIYLKPSSQTYSVNSTVTLEVWEDSGTTAVNAVQANFSYPANLLTFVSIDKTGSAFGTSAPSSGANGQVSIAAGATCSASCGTLTGNQLIAKVTFTTNAATGTASLPFVTGTALISASASTNILGSLAATGGGTYTIQ